MKRSSVPLCFRNLESVLILGTVNSRREADRRLAAMRHKQDAESARQDT